MTLPSNAQVAAALREIYGTEVVMQGTPSLVAEAMLTVMRIALAATQEQPSYLDIGGRTSSEFGNRNALRVRVGTETKWEWRELTEAEYETIIASLRAVTSSERDAQT